MPKTRWLALALLPFAGCNCHRNGGGPGPLQSLDSTPVATWQATEGAGWGAAPIDFGKIPIGGKKVLPIKLANAGSLDLDIQSVALQQGQSGAPEFLFAPPTNGGAPFGASVPQGTSAVAYLAFQPARGGEQTATLVIRSNSSTTPEYDVPIRGYGTNVSISVAPTVLDFGNVQIGTQKMMQVTFTNQGTDTSDPIQVEKIIGTQAADFGWTGAPGALAPGKSFTLDVTFTPAKPQGPAAALLPYLPCTSCNNPSSITLQGVGVDCDLVFDPDPATFPQTPQGSTTTLPVAMTNMGLASCSLGYLATEAAPSPFALTSGPSLPYTLAPGGSTSVVVSYTASGAANDQDTLVVFMNPLDGKGQQVNVPQEEATDPLDGNGTASPCSLQITPPSLNFGTPSVGTPVQKSLTLTNAGQQDCNLTGIGTGPGTDPAFSLPAGAPTSLTIKAGQTTNAVAVSCDINSTNPPLYHRGTLVFRSNDVNRPSAAIPLSAYVKGTGPYEDGWPKWHADNADQGRTKADTSANVGTILWKFRVGVPQTAAGPSGAVDPNPTYMNSPVVDKDGNVYQLGMDGTFWGLDPGAKILWQQKLLPPNPDEHPATPIIAADGTIYVETGCDGAAGLGGSPGLLYRIDSQTGAILGQMNPPADCRTDPSTGQCDTADGFDVNPSIGNDNLLFDGDDFGQTVVYTPASGGTFTETSHVILPWFGERVAVALDGDDNSYWCCLNVCVGVSSPAAGFTVIPGWSANGVRIGKTPGASSMNGFVNSDLAFDADHTGWLMVEAGYQVGGTGSTEVVAMDPQNGSLHWDRQLPSGNTPGSFNFATDQGLFGSDVGNSAPAIGADGTVYVGNVDGLYALDGRGGQIKWSFPTTSDVVSAPAIGGDGSVAGDDAIFFGTADGTFYALNQDGQLRFKVATQGKISSSPAIGPDGTVFVVSDDGQLYAIR